MTSRAERRAASARRIMQAAREEFGERGMEAATVRGIARRAGVDPSLVLQHYGSKQALFSLAVQPAAELGTEGVPGHLGQVLGLRLDHLPPETTALLRSMLTSQEAARTVREHLHERAHRLALASDQEDAELRAAILVSSILGMTIARHFLGLDALTDASPERAAELFEDWAAKIS